MRTSEELHQIAVDMHEKKIFSSQDIVLKLVDKSKPDWHNKLASIEYKVFLPLKQMSEKELIKHFDDGAYLHFEYLENAVEFNKGIPVFKTFQTLWHSEREEFLKWEDAIALRELLLKELV